MSNQAEKRKYEKRARAEQEAETRQRITDAAIELHGTIGIAPTTMSAIAERAGVQRATLYRHFPDLPAVFEACSSHWLSLNPPPNLEPWTAIEDPDQRLRTALEAWYAYYEQAEPMLANVIRDIPLLPDGERFAAPRLAYLDACRDVLLAGRADRRRRKVRAAIGHALAFETWRSLARDQGLSRRDAVDLAAAMVAAASEQPR